MSGGKHIAKVRGIIGSASMCKKIEALIDEKPWLVVRALSVLSEADRRKLKWIMARI